MGRNVVLSLIAIWAIAMLKTMRSCLRDVKQWKGKSND